MSATGTFQPRLPGWFCFVACRSPTAHNFATTTSIPPSIPSRLQQRPVGLLLDFGGVLFQTTKLPFGRVAAAEMLSDVLGQAGHDVTAERMHVSLDAGLRALKDWKNSAGRRREPAEL
ncbi:MAG TPA: hypothetical protein VGP24_00045, partial [Glaciihabitans sp.]|nr:hypothetical protein [Glaciihabitans sp.]